MHQKLSELTVTASQWRQAARRAARQLGRPIQTGANLSSVWAALRDWPATETERRRGTSSSCAGRSRRPHSSTSTRDRSPRGPPRGGHGLLTALSSVVVQHAALLAEDAGDLADVDQTHGNGDPPVVSANASAVTRSVVASTTRPERSLLG